MRELIIYITLFFLLAMTMLMYEERRLDGFKQKIEQLELGYDSLNHRINKLEMPELINSHLR